MDSHDKAQTEQSPLLSVADSYFERMFKGNDDPWHFRQRWYEQRKRALTEASLPKAHYASIFEPGCANGELSAVLAKRCTRLLCCDTSEAAVTLAERRLQPLRNVQVEQLRLPEQWPSGEFDLIVLSELCYYLSQTDLKILIECARRSLTADGALLACHWRGFIADCPQSAEQVHAQFDAQLGMQRIVQHAESDFLLDVWTRDGVSVAAQEGLR